MSKMRISSAISKTMGMYFRRKRLDAGLSQKDIADAIKCTPQFVMNWEKGKCMPPTKHWPVLIEKMNIPPQEMLGLLLRESKIYWREVLYSENKKGNRMGSLQKKAI